MSLPVYQPTTLAGLKILSRQITMPLFHLISNYNLLRQLIARDYTVTITLKIDQWYYISLTIFVVYAFQKREKYVTP